MAAIKKRSAALAALTQAALALPGIASAEVSADYLYSNYHEADVPGSRTASGHDESRYDVQSHLFRVGAPLSSAQLGVDLTYETMSGASPWFVQPDANGKPVQVMSGASIRDSRTAVDANVALPVGGVRAKISGGFSAERDYRSASGGAELEIPSADRRLTGSVGVGYSADRIEPTDGASAKFPTRIDHDTRYALSAYAGLSWVLDRDSAVQVGASYTRQHGYLSDPYKLAWIDSLADTVQDSRPDGRNEFTGNLKLRHHYAGPDGDLRIDYRYYHDDWHVDAHTLELGWYQNLPHGLHVMPALRWYSQSEAYFYAPYYSVPRGDGFASSDYRLSPFGAVSERVDLGWESGAWALGAGVEHYRADGSYAVVRVDTENPGLVDFLTAQARVTYKF